MGVLDFLGLGGSDPSQQGDTNGQQGVPQAQPNPQSAQNRQMLLQALMGGASAGPQNSFAGGLASGMAPLLRLKMMQQMQQAQGAQPGMQQQPDSGGNFSSNGPQS